MRLPRTAQGAREDAGARREESLSSLFLRRQFGGEKEAPIKKHIASRCGPGTGEGKARRTIGKFSTGLGYTASSEEACSLCYRMILSQTNKTKQIPNYHHHHFPPPPSLTPSLTPHCSEVQSSLPPSIPFVITIVTLSNHFHHPPDPKMLAEFGSPHTACAPHGSS